MTLKTSADNKLCAVKPIPTQQNFGLAQTERNCRQQFQKLDENGRELSKQAENSVGKGEIAHYE